MVFLFKNIHWKFHQEVPSRSTFETTETN